MRRKFIFNWKAGLATKKGLRLKPFMVFVIGLFISIGSFPATTMALDLSEHHEINLDSASKKKIGEKVWGEIKQFFTDAEAAIETENLDGLMALYSDRYLNGDHVKGSAKKIWIRIFARFNNMATTHNMRFIATTPESGVMIIRCSGLLVGIPEGGDVRITIDNWTGSDHVLSNEGGKWKLVGTSGKERKRFWFDKPMHPLF